MHVIIHGQCPKTKQCKNDECFFRQRDVYGRGAFYDEICGSKEAEMKEVKIDTEHGKAIFPKMRAEVGTNEICVICDSCEP